MNTYSTPYTIPEVGEMWEGVECMKEIELTGASALIAASAAAVTLALF